MQGRLDRRAFIGTATAAGVGLLAGCGGSGGDAPETPADPQAAVDEYLGETDNYDGIEDRTGTDAVRVDVGTEGNGGYFAFAPAAIRVDSATTVTWVWTGNGSAHNVVHEQGDFESETTSEEGHEFEHTFESAGTYRYYCAPHLGFGMKGAVVVE